MLSATVGAPASGLQSPITEQKPQIPEQYFDGVVAGKEEETAKAETTVPAVPATNGAQISVDAVTALQQVDDDVATTEQRTTGVENAQAAVASDVEEAEVEGVAAAFQQVQELEEEAETSRVAADAEVSNSEDTDAAGRSERNPLNLQI